MATILENLDLEIKHFENIWKHLDTEHLCQKTAAWFLTNGLVQVSSVFELSIANVANLTVTSLNEADLSDGSDAKLVTVRTSSYGKNYSAPVSGIHNKTGDLRVQCYERKLDQFYYFVIPHQVYKHIPKTSNIEIPFNLDGTPKKKNNCQVNWWNWEESSFEKMCNVSYEGL